MKKTICLYFALLISSVILMAQESNLRIAIFDPTSSGTSIDEGTKIAIREIISSTIVNLGGYNIVERSMLEKVMEEQSFTNSGVVDDNQATEIGKLAGANKVIVSVVTLTGGRNMLSVKIIDVKTAQVERQKVKVVTSGELLDIVEPLTLNLMDAQQSSDNTIISSNDNYIPENVVDMNSIPDSGSDDIIPQKGEVVFYLPAGFKTEKEKDMNLPIDLIFDKDYAGGGTISSGLCLRVPDPNPGQHKIRFGTYAYKINTTLYNFFELQVYRWNYLGKAMYGVNIKSMKWVGPKDHQ